MNDVQIPTVAEHPPTYAHPGDAGADLRSNETVLMSPGARVLVGTGVSIALPEGHVGFVVPRSGLAAKHGITIVNAPGTIDSGYRGEIKVILLNTSQEPYEIAEGDRIAQLVVQRVERVEFVSVDTLNETERGARGFGSSGFSATIEGNAQ
ncbi:dUTP diphosphatase [Humidisolicoccus flavus]|uniref:dUTP diphosphatase n=1 Tax=Humidisolicoccus flavus TaxID=3111414 RepID=UPI003244691C